MSCNEQRHRAGWATVAISRDEVERDIRDILYLRARAMQEAAGEGGLLPTLLTDILQGQGRSDVMRDLTHRHMDDAMRRVAHILRLALEDGLRPPTCAADTLQRPQVWVFEMRTDEGRRLRGADLRLLASLIHRLCALWAVAEHLKLVLPEAAPQFLQDLHDTEDELRRTLSALRPRRKPFPLW